MSGLEANDTLLPQVNIEMSQSSEDVKSVLATAVRQAWNPAMTDVEIESVVGQALEQCPGFKPKETTYRASAIGELGFVMITIVPRHCDGFNFEVPVPVS